MSKQSQHVLIALPHPLLHLVSLGLVSFIFTLFSLELSQFGTQLAPLWFPTSIMMVAFYRHAGRMWPGIALSCSLGNIAASILLFSTSSLNMTWTTINIVEAVVGAVLLRKLLPWYNPLQNLADWLRLALGSAIVPPLLVAHLVLSYCFRLQGYHLLWPHFPERSANNTNKECKAHPISLATTLGISVDFFSCGYLDVSVHRVRFAWPMYSAMDTPKGVGFPIRTSTDQSLFASSP